jgi:hypothetical protein
MSFSYKYNFYIAEIDTFIAEIKVNNLPSDAPKSKKYHWLLLSKDGVRKLDFVSMDKGKRVFKQGTLEIDLLVNCTSAMFTPVETSDVADTTSFPGLSCVSMDTLKPQKDLCTDEMIEKYIKEMQLDKN